MNENREEKKFDPYTGEELEEPTYEKEVWEPLQAEEESRRADEEQKKETSSQQEQQTADFMKVQNYSYGGDYGENGYTKEKRGETNGLSIACLILGILSVLSAVTCCLSLFSIPLAVASIVCGAMSGKKKDERDKTVLIGYITSVLGIVLTLIMLIVAIVGFINYNTIIGPEFHREFDFDLDSEPENFFGGGQEVSNIQELSRFL